MLMNDLEKSWDECCKAFSWISKMDKIRQGVIVELCFNMGLGRLKGFKKMLAACERGDYETASVEMLDSLWARQVGQRAKTLANIMKGTDNA